MVVSPGADPARDGQDRGRRYEVCQAVEECTTGRTEHAIMYGLVRFDL
jgi:hypothetical protein